MPHSQSSRLGQPVRLSFTGISPFFFFIHDAYNGLQLPLASTLTTLLLTLILCHGYKRLRELITSPGAFPFQATDSLSVVVAVHKRFSHNASHNLQACTQHIKWFEDTQTTAVIYIPLGTRPHLVTNTDDILCQFVFSCLYHRLSWCSYRNRFIATYPVKNFVLCKHIIKYRLPTL